MAPLVKLLTLLLTQPWEMKQSDLWGSLATQVSFLGEFQTHRKLCLHPPSKNPNPNQARKYEWCLRINSQGCSGLLTQGHSCICACTPPPEKNRTNILINKLAYILLATEKRT